MPHRPLFPSGVLAARRGIKEALRLDGLLLVLHTHPKSAPGGCHDFPTFSPADPSFSGKQEEGGQQPRGIAVERDRGRVTCRRKHRQVDKSLENRRKCLIGQLLRRRSHLSNGGIVRQVTPATPSPAGERLSVWQSAVRRCEVRASPPLPV